jgi:Tfp pilus assembly protein PilX
MAMNRTPSKFRAHARGFTLLYAVLISSVLLAIGIAIFEITVRELRLSSIVRESEYAFYAADAGLECAMKSDFKYAGTESAFAGSISTTTGAISTGSEVASGVSCASQDVVAHGTPPSPYQADTSTWTLWSITIEGDVYTTVFYHSLSSGVRCAIVTVEKTAPDTSTVQTVIESRGYNVACGSLSTDTNAVERTLRVSY